VIDVVHNVFHWTKNSTEAAIFNYMHNACGRELISWAEKNVEKRDDAVGSLIMYIYDINSVKNEPQLAE